MSIFKKRAFSGRNWIVTLVILAIVVAISFSGRVAVEVKNGVVTVQGRFSGTSVRAADIVSLELTDAFSPGRRTMGSSTFQTYSGTFENDALGAYKLYAYKSANCWVILKTEAVTLVFALKTDEQTRAAYADIEAAMSEGGA